jgi:hypothetical protein
VDVETADAIERLSERIDALEVSLRGEMTTMRDDLRAEVATMRDELRRHTDVVAESLRDDIRMVAEGVAHLAVKIDRLGR